MTFATDQLAINIFILLIGLFLLLKGSDWFVEAASFMARKFDVSEIVIGLTLVSIGTSLPELGTNVYASFYNEGDIALGNVVGSNITNIALVLGLAALLHGKLPVPKSLVKRDSLFMLAIFIIFYLLALFSFDNTPFLFSRLDGSILTVLFCTYIYFIFKHKDMMKDAIEEAEEEHKIKSLSYATLLFSCGLIMIFAGSKMAVDTVVITAETFQIPKAIISATIIAFGTSVPELAVTLTSIVKKKNDLALGNIIGSGIFNIVLVMGVAAIISPITVSSDMINILIPLMIFLGILLILFMRTGYRLVRLEGIILLLIYISFIGYNISKII